MTRRSRRKARSARHDRQSRGDLRGILLIGAVLVGLAGFGYAFWTQKQQHRVLDAVSQCPKEPRETDSITTVLVDMTDGMTTAQKKDFHNQLEAVRDAIPRYGRLEIFAVDSTARSLLTPIASLCNPGSGREKWSKVVDGVGLRRRCSRCLPGLRL